MEQMSSDWHERLEKAQTNEEFIGLLNEIHQTAYDHYLTTPEGQGSSIMERPPMLIPLTSTTKGG